MSGESELSRPIPVEQLGTQVKSLKIDADDGERRAIAGRLGLLSLPRLAAELEIRRRDMDGAVEVSVTGSFEASVERNCVVSLEPFVADLRGEVDERFSSAGEAMDSMEDFDLDRLDEPEPLPEGHLDLGELLVQLLSLELEPYPRKPDAVLSEADSDGEQSNSPFAVLKNRVPPRS